jgi:hypothetical protein
MKNSIPTVRADARRVARLATVAAIAALPIVAWSVGPAAAATTAPGGSALTLTVPIGATPLNTAGSISLVLSPPDPCDTASCIDVVPGLVQISLSPPDPCITACEAPPPVK